MIEQVYDLTVEDDHEFFANGVLVHNSTDTLVYGRRVIAHLFETGAITNQVPARSAYVDPMGLGKPEDEFDAKPEDDDPYKSWDSSNDDDWG